MRTFILFVLTLVCGMAPRVGIAQEDLTRPGQTRRIAGDVEFIASSAPDSRDDTITDDTIRVTGRFGYNLPDGRFIPAPQIRVVPYRRTNGSGTWCGGSHPAVSLDGPENLGLTNADGYFDITFTVGSCLTCLDTDIFVVFEMVNGSSVLGVTGTAAIWRDNESARCLPAARNFETPLYDGVAPNSHLEIGTHVPSSVEGNAIVHTQVNFARMQAWLQAQGLVTDYVIGWWDDPVSETRIVSPSEVPCVYCADFYLQVGTSDWFDDFAVCRLAATAWLTRNVTTPALDFCNGVCDGTECSFCFWCPENTTVAYWKGVASWMAAEALTSVATGQIYRNTDVDRLSACASATQDPWTTPGIFAAVLRDLADGDYDDHPQYPGVRDRTAWGAWSVLDVIRLDQPLSPAEFFDDYAARHGFSCADLWETAANCGYDIDVIGPGVVQGGVTSTSHVAGVASTNAVVDVQWGTPNDDCSGVDGYSVSVTADTPVLPDAVADVGAVNAWRSGVLTTGSWWINVRAVDASGRWSTVYASFGPVVIDNPTPANLTHVSRAGWDGPVVPRAAADAGSFNAPAPATLPGNTAGTWWNSSIENIGFQSTGTGSGTWVLADGLGFFNPINPVDHADAVPALAALTEYQSLNLGPIQVRGGRHTFGAVVDFVGEIAEDDEFDNGWAKSWVWTPLQVSLGGSVFRLAPPPRIGGWEYDPVSGYYNCDGLRFTQSPDAGTEEGYWNALTLAAVDDEVDYDARLHVASSGAGDGFRANSGYSTRPAGCLDAVFVNANVQATADWDVGVVQTTDTPALASYESHHIRSTLIAYDTSVAATLAANQPMLLLEVYVPVAGFTSFVVRTNNGESPIHLLWLDSTFATGDMDDNAAAATSDESGLARMDVNVATADYHCLVVYRDPKDGLMGQPIDITVEVEPTPPDLIPYAAGGWARPLVPRPLNDATTTNVPLPGSLNGGTTSTYLNVCTRNIGPVAVSGSTTQRIFVDGAPLIDVVNPGGYVPSQIHREINHGPVLVRGGLHTLHVRTDGPNDHEEIWETNNDFGEQWAWQGPTLAYGPTTGQPQPGDPRGGWETLTASEVWFNADGFRTPVFDPGLGLWAGVAATPGASSDVNLRLHVASNDPTVAFREVLAESTQPGSETDFLLLDFASVAAAAYDVGVSHAAGSAGYQLDLVTSSVLDPAAGESPVFTLAADELLHVYDVGLTAGLQYVTLRNLSGGADLALALFEPGQGAMGRAEAVVPASGTLGGPGEDDIVGLPVVVDGTHGLAVYKVGSADASLNAQYTLEFEEVSDSRTVALPRATRITRIQPNPFNPRTAIHYGIEREGPVDLRVYSLRGVIVRTLVDAVRPAGMHHVVWDGTDDAGRQVSSGVYLAVVRANGQQSASKMVLIE